MRTKYAMVCCGVVLLLCAALVAAQDCLESVGSWPYGTNNHVAAEGSTAVMGNGAAVQIVDLSDPTTPVVVGEVYTTLMVDAVAIAGNRAYAATRDALHVIDISMPAAPVILGMLPFSRTVQAIEVAGDRVFLAGGDLDIVDVSTPSAPVMLGSWTELYTRDVAVLGSYVVVTVSYDGLRVLDVSDPASPTVAGQLDLGPDRSASWLDLAGSHAIVIGLDSSVPGQRLFSVDLSVPTSPSLVTAVPGGGSDVVVHNGLAMVPDIGGVYVWDVSDPTAPLYRGSVVIHATDDKRIAAIDGYALVAGDIHGLAVVDIDDPSNPVVVGQVDVPGKSMGADWTDDLLVVAAEERGLRFVDLADPATPVELGHLDVELFPMDVVVDGNLVYTTGYGGNGFAVVDVSGPAAPTVIASLPGLWGGEIIGFADGLAFIACADPGLRIVDVSVPAAPVQVGALDTQGTTWEYMAVSGDLGLVVLVDVANDCSATVVDVSNPTVPTVVSTIDLGPAGGAAFSGRYLLIGDLPLRIFDMSNPAVPVERDPYDPWGAPAWFGAIEVTGSVAYAHLTTTSFDSLVVAIDVGQPTAPANLGSAPLVRAGRRMSAGRSGVIVSADDTGFEHLSLCQGPLFADGFETGDTTAWSGVMP